VSPQPRVKVRKIAHAVSVLVSASQVRVWCAAGDLDLDCAKADRWPEQPLDRVEQIAQVIAERHLRDHDYRPELDALVGSPGRTARRLRRP
jgi:hypothetical protein